MLNELMPPTGTPPSIVASVEDVVASVGDYSVDAYYFIQAGIHAAADRVHGVSERAVIGTRHVTGRQLCETLRDLAIQRWGMMASAVLRAWGLHSTKDIGLLVFAFVDAGHWQKQPTDCLEEFIDVYSFREAFDQHYRIPLGEKVE